MRHRKRLYDIAKQSGRSEDWAAYRSMRNQVNNDLQCAQAIDRNNNNNAWFIASYA